MNRRHDYSEDIFADTRMSFGEHLEDLRKHLWRAVFGLIAGMVVSFFFADKVLGFITSPVEKALMDYHLEYLKQKPGRSNLLVDEVHKQIHQEVPVQELAVLNQPRELKIPIPAAELHSALAKLDPQFFKDLKPPAGDAPDIELKARVKPVDFLHELGPTMNLLGKRYTLTALSVLEGFMMYFFIALLTGLIITCPYVFYQLWAFVAEGLYPHEKKYIHYYLPFSIFLFLAGIAICQFVVIPAALNALLAFNRWLDIEPDLRLSTWLGFAILMPLVFGVAFQTPMVMLFINKIGILTAEDFAAKRRMAIFGIFIFAAVITPSVDPWSMLLLALPVWGLYEFGIVLIRYTEKRRQADLEEDEEPYNPEANETVTNS